MKNPLSLAAALLVIATAALGATVPASAATTAPTPRVTLTANESGDLAAGAPLHTQVTIDNPTSTGTAVGSARLTVDPTAFTSRSALEDWFAGKSKATLASRAVATAPVPAVPAQLSDSVDVDAAAGSLPFTKAGVYGVAVELTAGTTVIGSARTAVTWNGTGLAQVPVAIAVPLTVPAGESEFLTATQLATYTGPTGILTTELADVENTQVAVGIDPRVIASIRLLGNTVPASARQWLDELRQLPNETFPLAWADADLTAPLHAGSPTVVTPKSLDYAINPSLFGSSTGSTPGPTPTSGSDDSVVPTSASLVAWNYTMPQLGWPAESSVEPSDLTKLGAAGITSVILTSKNVDDPDGRGIAGASGVSGSTAVAVSDDVLSGYFRAAAKSGSRAGASAPLTELTSTLALVGSSSGAHPRTVLITLDRNWSSTDADFSRAASELYARSWVGTATLSSALAQSRNKVMLDKDTESDARIEQVRQLLLAEQGVVLFSPIATAPATITSSYRLKLLSLLSNEWQGSSASWMTAARAYLAQANKLTTSVQVAKSSKILGLADQLGLPISISNDSDQDVTVRLSVRSTTPLVTIDDADQSQLITIGANSQKRVQIPIQAASNGNARLIVSLRSATGRPVGTAVRLTVNVQAGWETFGTLVFVALIVGLFAFGIIRRFVMTRRGDTAPEASAATRDGAGNE